MNNNQHSFEGKNIVTGYDKKIIIDGVDITIPSNKISVIIGSNGCGKSTFLRTLNRMNDLIENVTIKGKIEVDGEDIYQTEDVIKLRTKVGMVFQKPNPAAFSAPMPMQMPASGNLPRTWFLPDTT